MSAFEYANLALLHLQFAGVLALLFALVSAVYLAAVWRLGGRLRVLPGLVLHTLFFAWQSNVAYLAVVTLRGARASLDTLGDEVPAAAWAAAPWLVPGAAVLYASMLLLCLVFAGLCVSGKPVRGAPG